MKMEKKLQNIYLTLQAHQILLIIYLKDYLEFNVNQNMIIKCKTYETYVEHMELNISIAIVFWNMQTSKMI